MHTLIEPQYDSQERRVAARHGLSFHVTSTYVVTHDGFDSSREATDEEKIMWQALEGCGDPLPATKEEVLHSWEFIEGPCTISTKDWFGVSPELGYKYIEVVTQRDLILFGHYASWYLGGWPIYVSKHIPVGHYYKGPRVAGLHKTTLELSDSDYNQVVENLHMFTL